MGGWFKLATHMPLGDLILSLAGPVVLLGLAFVLRRRKLHREFPFFFTYTLYAAAAGILRVTVTHQRLIYFVLYWSTEALYGILALLVLREVFHRVFALAYAAYRWFRLLLPMTVLVILGVSVWGALFRPLGWGYIPRAISVVYWFDLGVHALEGTILLLVLALTIAFPVAWRQHEFGILAGFGISACVGMIADLLVLQWGYTYEVFFRYGPPVAYLLATLVWLDAFFHPPKPTRRSQMDLQELLEVIRRSRELMEKLLKALGLNRRIICPPI